MDIVVTFHFVNGSKRSTIVKAKDVDEASLIISKQFYQNANHVVFELLKREDGNEFEVISDKVEMFEVFRDHVMFIDYEV